MLRGGQVLQLVTMALLGLAMVMVQSASVNIGHDLKLAELFTSLPAMYALAATAALLIAGRIDVRRSLVWTGWKNPIYWLLGLCLMMVVASMVPGIGVEINGARRWLPLGKLTFQPSELVKWVILLALAYWCVTRGSRMRFFVKGLLPALAIVGVACLLIVKEDLGTAALIGLVGVVLLLAGGAKLWHITAVVPLAAGAMVYMIAREPYRMARLTSFMDPWADPKKKGYQAIQSLLAIAQGGVTGRGLGNGIQKFGYLPADNTDFIFAVICEELGLAGAAMVVLMYLTLIWFGLSIVKETRDLFGRLFVLGVTLTVGLQAAINLAVVTVMVPTKGIALPLLSSGGTGWIVTAAAIGLVAGIDRGNQLAVPRMLESLSLTDRADSPSSACSSAAPQPSV